MREASLLLYNCKLILDPECFSEVECLFRGIVRILIRDLKGSVCFLRNYFGELTEFKYFSYLNFKLLHFNLFSKIQNILILNEGMSLSNPTQSWGG